MVCIHTEDDKCIAFVKHVIIVVFDRIIPASAKPLATHPICHAPSVSVFVIIESCVQMCASTLSSASERDGGKGKWD